MAVNKTIRNVKNELSQDQNLLLSAFKLESFYKKYKIIIFFIIAIIILVVAFFVITGIMKKQSIREGGEILYSLEKIKDLDSKKIEDLEKRLSVLNPKLYDFYIFNKLSKIPETTLMQKENIEILKRLQDSKNEFISTMAKYEYLNVTRDENGLSNFKVDLRSQNDNLELSNQAKFQAVYLYIKNNELDKAKGLLDKMGVLHNSFNYESIMRFKQYVDLEQQLKEQK